MVGIYLVFSSLIIPALASRNATRYRLAKAYAVGGLGYLFGLGASTLFDLPTGAIVVWAVAIVGIVFSRLERSRVRPATCTLHDNPPSDIHVPGLFVPGLVTT